MASAFRDIYSSVLLRPHGPRPSIPHEGFIYPLYTYICKYLWVCVGAGTTTEHCPRGRCIDPADLDGTVSGVPHNGC